MQKNSLVVWALCSTAPQWIEYCNMGSADTIEGARIIGASCGWKCWRIRKCSDGKPNYIGPDDGKWLDEDTNPE